MDLIDHVRGFVDNHSMLWLAILLDAALKGVVVLMAASAVAVMLRKSSAATHHLLWLLGIVSLIGLPLLSVLLPAWQWRVPTASPVKSAAAIRLTPTPSIETGTAGAPSELQNSRLLDWEKLLYLRGPANDSASAGSPPVAWAAGAAIVLLPCIAGRLRLQRVRRTGRGVVNSTLMGRLAELRKRLGISRDVTLLQSDGATMPMTWGTLRPVILLPKEANAWDADRCRVVLLHELAHVKRCDCLTQDLAHLACALYWFNPLTWLAARRLRAAREGACDDLVIATESKASVYAEHLVNIARSFAASRLIPFAAVAMARTSRSSTSCSHLEGRVAAILDAKRRRRQMTWRAVSAGLLTAAILVMPLASVRPVPEALAQEVTTVATTPGGAPVARPRVIFAPEQAVEIDPKIMWVASHWAADLDTEMAWLDTSGESPRFNVLAPSQRKIWIRYLDIPVDSMLYPIVVLEYRATNIKDGSYVMWMDDTTGPDTGGVQPFHSAQLIDDGKPHEIRCDLRSPPSGKPPVKGNITGLAFSVHCGPTTPAMIELRGLRFETAPDQASALSPEPLADDVPVIVRVLDDLKRPIQGARVTVDAERPNHARSALTDSDGLSTIAPLKNTVGKHMVRVEKEGMTRVELGDVSLGATSPVELSLDPLIACSGRVEDLDGKPVKGAVVSFRIEDPRTSRGAGPGRFRIASPGPAITGADGRWSSPTMSGKFQNVSLRLAHPDYLSDPSGRQPSPLTAEQLRNGTAVAVLKRDSGGL